MVNVLKSLTLAGAAGLALLAGPLVAQSGAASAGPYANDRDRARGPELARREADWRNGAIVYQVIVDRFVPPPRPEEKRELYPPPKRLMKWDEKPLPGTENKEAGLWSHEIDFWGGDIASLKKRLDYVSELGATVLYLNPIHLAYTNHKYDAQDYFAVSPEYGDREEIAGLAEEVHAFGMKLVLDGVFNHMGRTAPMFLDALGNAESPHRGWFYFGPEYAKGYRAWVNVGNLPEVNLENPAVRARLWNDPDSVIQGYLKEGVDGWRLDVAFDIGFEYLAELTQAAHRAKPGSLVVGEIWNYPEEWSPAVDSVMNMTAREIILQFVQGNVDPAAAAGMFERMVEDTGIEPLLKSWIILDNHDTRRLATALPEQWQQRMAQVLQFTVPGSPCLYYGVELGMQGGDDPTNRAPMQWELNMPTNETLQWTKRLIEARKQSRALRIGDFRSLDAKSMMAFLRRTDRIADLRLVAVNPTDKPVKEMLLLRDSKFMSYGKMRDLLGDREIQAMAGTVWIEMPPHSAAIFAPVIPPGPEYTPYKRVQ